MRLFLILSSFLLISFESFAKKITVEDVKKSALTHYPLILSKYEMINVAKGDYLASKGIFDIRLKQEYQDYTRGYYDGKLSNTSIENQTRVLGAKIYAGYRKSYGDFAQYDGNYNTANSGEIYSGISVPLLKNRSTDQNRINEILAKLDVEESEIYLLDIKNKILRDATKAYWQVLVATKNYQIYQDLYNLSLNRQKQLQEQLSKGGIAEIILVENEKNLIDREIQLLEAQRDLNNSLIYLSLFYRLENGKPAIATQEDFAMEDFEVSEINLNLNQDKIKKALLQRPEIKLLDIKKKSAKVNLDYSKNLAQPDLNLDFISSKDLGSGPDRLTQSNNLVKLNFSIPLQFSEAKGKIATNNSKIRKINFEKQITQDKILYEISQLANNVNNAVLTYNNYKKQVNLAKKLEEAERNKFNHGHSDFFLVNLREQQTANSKIKKMKTLEEYQKNLADYKAAIFEML